LRCCCVKPRCHANTRFSVKRTRAHAPGRREEGWMRRGALAKAPLAGSQLALAKADAPQHLPRKRTCSLLVTTEPRYELLLRPWRKGFAQRRARLCLLRVDAIGA
jgi:hypothetical protein